MAGAVTLEQVEALATQLSLQEQLKLLACISEQLSTSMPPALAEESREERLKQERLRLAEELLIEVEGIEDDSQGEFDAAEAIRRMREERTARICQSDA